MVWLTLPKIHTKNQYHGDIKPKAYYLNSSDIVSDSGDLYFKAAEVLDSRWRGVKRRDI